MSHQPIILILTDGRPGHETQSIGIAKLLNHEQSYAVQFLKIQQPSKLIKQLFKKTYSWLPKSWMLKHFLLAEQIQQLCTESKIEFIVSAGGDTLLPNALVKSVMQSQNHKVKNIIATSLRGMPESAYDLVFTIDAAKKDVPPYIYYPVAPNKLISFQLNQDVQDARQALNIASNVQCWTILIGADTAEVKIGGVKHWVDMLQKLSANHPDDQIIVSTSRRTPPAFEHSLKILQQHSNIRLILVGEGNQTPIQDLIYAADYVVCSPDSTSMVSESLMAEKKLLVPLFADSDLSDQFVDYYEKIKEFVCLKDASQIDDAALMNIQAFAHKDELAKLFQHATLKVE
ncbi:ELM1/GtrOC1 family putative glycosyltransferase [Acinetobacter bouvetii]|uniref:Nucleoside-diphosphate sugar epimerase n=1 Tax=Acinetobacter bouvetii TaxID=202951 RepID=A0A811GG19_9GAMM|nr:ELM1/GtrOC1 family putative glycosyltransferase [Acinetobacter bouvetii]CAB1217432.1 hypothetical protein SFB21_2091 [Acinetobacter bouvetii]